MRDKFLKILKSRNVSGELFILKSYNFGINFENNIFKGVEEGEVEGFSVRVKKNGRIGFSYAERNQGIEDVVDSAISSAQFGEKVDFNFAKAAELPSVKCFDEEIVNESRDADIKLGEELVNFVNSLKDGIKAGFSLGRSVIREEIITSEGFYRSFDKTVKTISVSGVYVEENNFLEVYASQSRSLNNLFDLETLKEKINSNILAANHTARVTSGRYPVIFTPFAVGELLLPVMFALNGKNVLRGYSLLKGKLSKEVFSSYLTLVDNPTLTGGTYSAPFDDEGITSQRKELIAKGVVSNYLSDLYTSSKLKIVPGNASRGISSPPYPSSSNIVIPPGDVPLSNMLQSDDAVLIESLMGVQMGNVMGGEVSGNIELGFLVHSGKIVGRIKNAMVNLNVFESLKDIALSKEHIWVGKYLSPYIYIPNASISAK